MRSFYKFFLLIVTVTLYSCTRNYYDDVEESINGGAGDFDFIALSASADSVDMYEPVTITAVARGDNLKYEWEKVKGSLVPNYNGHSNVAQFWGCNTCFFWLTVKCTVSNESGSKSKEVNIYVKHPLEDDLKEKGLWEDFLRRYGLL